MNNLENSLEIPVSYQGEELLFRAELLMMGYIHKIQVEVEEQLVMFEPDEERNYRPVLDTAQLEKGVKLNINLLKEIAAVINSVIK